jgi:hypothetical protein
MTRVVNFGTLPQIARRRKAVFREIARLQEELEEIEDSLDLLHARARNLGKPHLTHQEVLAKFGLK